MTGDAKYLGVVGVSLNICCVVLKVGASVGA